MLAKRPCPVCEQRDVAFLRAQHFALPEGHPLSDGYLVVCCDTCGLVYADTNTGQDTYDCFYTSYSKYADKATGTGSGETILDQRRLHATADRIAGFLRNPESRILDVGCANGGLLSVLQEMGYARLVGIDPSPACVARTRERGIEAHRGSLFAPLGVDPFDCVILSHTLEHVQDTGQAGHWLREVLKPDGGGCVYVEVPDAARYAEYIHAPFQEFNTEHINHFSLTCLKDYLHMNGFRVVGEGDGLIEAAPGMAYPIIYCFARTTTALSQGSIEKDTLLRLCIDRYIALSGDLLDQVETRLQESLVNLKGVIVWGAGQLTMKLLLETCLSKMQVVAFVDSNPINQGRFLRGTPIVAPEAVRGLTEPIVIGSILSQASIVEQIRRMGLENQLILLKA